MDIDVICIPVGLVSLEYDCVLGCKVLNNIWSAICDRIRILTICVICCIRIILNTKLTTHGFIEGSVHWSKYVVTEHCCEVCARSFQIIL